jgi:uncharacterized protein YjlB
MPFLVYKGAIDVDNEHPEKTIEGLFGANGWGEMWRNGVYDYLHYHATVHEALGVARGHARVRFGGDRGRELEISAGDVAILPAGTGHQSLSASRDFCVIGAYPPGPQMHVTRPTSENYRKALKTIPEVKLPKTDPVMGADGPLVRLWRRPDLSLSACTVIAPEPLMLDCFRRLRSEISENDIPSRFRTDE